MDNDLLDSIETAFSIECIACGQIAESNEETADAAASDFSKDGWKRNEDGEVICPQCWKLPSGDESEAPK